MAMTRAEMRSMVRTALGRTVSDVPDADLNTYLNWSQESLALSYTFESMKGRYQTTTVVGQKQYNFPERVKEIESLRLIDGASSKRLPGETADAVDWAVPYPEQSTGTPYEFVVYGDFFELVKVPDAVVTMWMRCGVLPSDMGSDSASSPLPYCDKALIFGALSIGQHFLREIELAESYGQRALGFAREAVERDKGFGREWEPKARPFSGGATSPAYSHLSPFDNM